MIPTIVADTGDLLRALAEAAQSALVHVSPAHSSCCDEAATRPCYLRYVIDPYKLDDFE